MTAILPGTSGGPGDGQDLITARHYRHAALGDRPVVRLVPQTLAPAEDLSAEYLGFAVPERAPVVGVGKRTALGFPAWALVNDPDNAHHALKLVKEVERLARLAKSKPGAAKDGFAVLGDLLGKSAPQLLPSFYEQAGRIYLEHGNATFAGTLFGRAREAEEMHNLTIDRAHLRDVCLEFAFAGALTAKALSKLAKTLAAHWPPQEALDEFTTLCVERTKGGLRPYTGMPEDIARLAKAAGRDLAEVGRTVLSEVLFTSAINKAGPGFWKFYRKVLVAMDSPEVRAQLLVIIPEDAAVHELWLAILRESGAVAALTEPGGQPGVPAAWLTRFVAARIPAWTVPHNRLLPLLDLVSAMAGRLRADGVPVDLFGDRDQTSLDLLDLCVAEGIALADTRDTHMLPIHHWLSDTEPGGRDLTALAASDFLPLLVEGMDEFLKRNDSTRKMSLSGIAPVLAAPGLRIALRHWLERQAVAVRADSLAALNRALIKLRPLQLAEIYADTPQTVERIASTNVARTLATTLRTGIFDEFGWPALDEAAVRLLDGKQLKPGKPMHITAFGEGWPVLVVGHGKQVIAVGPDGILLNHILRIPPGLHDPNHNPSATFVDGRLLIAWQGPNGPLGYWTDAPDKILDMTHAPRWSGHRYYSPSIPTPDGGQFSGDRTLYPGDVDNQPGMGVHGDGTSYWRFIDGRWEKVNPATGEPDGHSLPAWIEDFATEVATLDLHTSWLRPAVPGTGASPVGEAGGMLGLRVGRQADKTWLCERIDGVQARLAHVNDAPAAVIRFPGSDAARILTPGWSKYRIFDEAGTLLTEIDQARYRPVMARGTAFVTPYQWWPCLRVRDEAGSRALRTVTEDVARDLLSAEDPAVALAAALPDITHPELIRGVLGLVEFAKGHAEELRTYREMRAEQPVPVEQPVDNDTSMYMALRWTGSRYRSHMTNSMLLSSLSALAAAREKPAGLIEDIELRELKAVIPYPAAIAWRAASPLTSAEHRGALTGLLRALVTGGFTDGRWRVVEAVPDKEVRKGEVVATPSGFVVAWPETDWAGHSQPWNGLQFSTGKFDLPKGWRLHSGQLIRNFPISEFCDALAANGPLTWNPGLADRLAAEAGLSMGEATFLISGLPGTQAYGEPAMTAGERKLTGLSASVVNSARERFRQLSTTDNVGLLGAFVPDSPADLWTSGPRVDTVAEQWVRRFGRRTAVPDDVLASAQKLLPIDNTAEYVSGVANPSLCEWLTSDFKPEHIPVIRNVLPWLAYHLPVGSPVRAALPQAFALTQQRLRDPEFLYPLGSSYVDDDTPNLLKLLNLPPGTTNHAEGLVRLTARGGGRLGVSIQTSEYRLEHGPLLAALTGFLYFPDTYAVDHLPVLLGDVLQEALSVTAPNSTDPDSYYQDPAVSVPDLVATAAARYRLDSDAAALYLQLLALPDPTDANVARWTGWKPARLKAARAALAETALVVNAKRARAGRTLFLPGGWRAHKSPFPPIEEWKAALFELGEGRPQAAIVPLMSVEQLFRKAWQRVEDGCAPAYEELRT
jgi:hypothetical protein